MWSGYRVNASLLQEGEKDLSDKEVDPTWQLCRACDRETDSSTVDHRFRYQLGDCRRWGSINILPLGSPSIEVDLRHGLVASAEIETHAHEIEKPRVRINKLIAAETGQKSAEVEKETGRDLWMNAEEAMKYGLLARLVTTRAQLAKISTFRASFALDALPVGGLVGRRDREARWGDTAG